ncbi:hypothetical protein [Micromonospora sp. NPDC049240]|uniref:hypothetical protein n=1 Tax=Micromonospora sp. NPDC049240 TaxID=3155151 RepID=UPI0033E1BB15
MAAPVCQDAHSVLPPLDTMRARLLARSRSPFLGAGETIEGTFEGVAVCSMPTICTASDAQRATNMAYPPAYDLKVRKEREGMTCRLYWSTDGTRNTSGPNFVYVKYWVICRL